MPPTKKKRSKSKKSVKKPRSSATKKKKGVVDKPWKSSLKFENKGTPENSRSNTPSCSESVGKSRNVSMTSRDFIRQVLEFDRASESDLDSSEDGNREDDGMDQSSDVDLKRAIKDSLQETALAESSDEDDDGSNNYNNNYYLSESEDDHSLAADATNGKGGTVELVANASSRKKRKRKKGSALEMDSANDSSTLDCTDAVLTSIYAPMPEFIPDDMPVLTLPASSNDLLIDKKHVLKAAGIYEMLRVYSQIIRLSPFIFEEFAAAIADGDSFSYNPLLHEIHSCLLKTILREEDSNQTSFGPVDLKDSMNSLFFFNDAMTFPHVVREYLRSDRDIEFQKALELISEPDYPNVSVDKKMTVLDTLCNMLLSSNCIREELSADGFIKYEDHCRVCQKTGNVLCCDKCSGVYHLYCLDPPLDQLPEGDWVCNFCLDNEVRGVSDCINSTESRSMNRHDPLGYDRHYRKYWFLIRRIIIETEDGDVTYISTPKQFERLLKSLDDKWERRLIHSLNQRKQEIIEHMNITHHLTEERRGQRKSYLTQEDDEMFSSPEKTEEVKVVNNDKPSKPDTPTTETEPAADPPKSPEDTLATSTSSVSNPLTLPSTGNGVTTSLSLSTSSSLGTKMEAPVELPDDILAHEQTVVTTYETVVSEQPTAASPTAVDVSQQEEVVIDLIPQPTEEETVEVQDGQPTNFSDLVENASMDAAQEVQVTTSVEVEDNQVDIPAATEPSGSASSVRDEGSDGDAEGRHGDLYDEYSNEDADLDGEDNSFLQVERTFEDEEGEVDSELDEDELVEREIRQGEMDEGEMDEGEMDEGEMDELEEGEMDEGEMDELEEGEVVMGNLGDSDDGQVMDSDEDDEDMYSSDMLEHLVEGGEDDMDSDESDDKIGYSVQLDGAVDSENGDKDNSTEPQQLIINTSANQPNQAGDAPAIVKTSSGNQVIKLVNLSATNGTPSSLTPQLIRTISQAGSGLAIKAAATSQSPNTLLNTAAQGIVSIDRFGNVTRITSGANQASSSEGTSTPKVVNIATSGGEVTKVTPSNPVGFGKTYGKKTVIPAVTAVSQSDAKSTVITVPVTATLEHYKSGQSTTRTATANTLLTSITSKPITLTNTQSIPASSKTAQILNISQAPISSAGNNQLVIGMSPMKLQSSADASVGIPIKLIRSGGGASATIQTIDGSKLKGAPFTQIVQKIQQDSPTTTTQAGNILKIISDKSAQLSTPQVSSIVNRVVSSSHTSATATVTSTPGTTPQYRILKRPPAGQKVFINPGADAGTVIKTKDGKIINLKNVTTSPTKQNLGSSLKIVDNVSGSVSGSQVVIRQAEPSAVSRSVITIPNIIRPNMGNVSGNKHVIRPLMPVAQRAISTQAATPRPKVQQRAVAVSRSVTLPRAVAQPRVVTQPSLIQAKPAPSAANQHRIIKPMLQTVVLVDKDGQRSTVTVDARTLDNAKKQVISVPTSQTAKVNQAELLAVKEKDGTKKYMTKPQKSTSVAFNARQELAQHRQKLEMKIAKVLAAREKASEAAKPPVVLGPFKLGMDDGYKNYVNQYTENSCALSKNQLQEEKDRKRHLSYKFSLTSASEFKWVGKVYGSVENLMDTIRHTLKQFEEAIPLCFMHPHWSTLRIIWLQALANSKSTNRFITVLGWFQSNIKPVLFNAVWNDSLGHLSMIRQTAKDKDEVRKKEKYEKRQQELLEANPLQQARSTTIKYTKGLKHQLHKLKGEEFRLSDASGSGWVWVRAARSIKSSPADRTGHRAYLNQKRLEFLAHKNKSPEDSAVETEPIPSDLIDFDEYRNKSCDVVNVSEELSSNGTMYPKLAIPQCRGNNLLKHRLLLEKVIQQKFAKMSQADKEKAAKVKVEDAPAKDESSSSQPMDVSEPAAADEGKATASQPARQLTIQGTDQVITRTKDKVDLFPVFEASRKVSGRRPKADRNKLCRPHRYRTRSGKSCPFVLVQQELRALARSGGRLEVAGFNYTTKNAPGFWCYPCPRPRFKMSWEYRLNNDVTSIHGVANLLRVLWSCIRWDDMNTKPPPGGSNVSTNDSDITTREILDQRDIGPTKLQSQYKVRTIIIPFNFLEQPARIETSEPIREGLRKRKKHQMKQPAQPSTSVVWLPEEQLELWEISTFAEKAALTKTGRHKKPKKIKKETPEGPSIPFTPLQKPAGPEELTKVKAQLEEQLKQQRAAAQAQRLSEKEKTKPAANPVMTIKGPDGKDTLVRGVGQDQKLVRLPNGKFTLVAKDKADPVKKVATTQPPTSSEQTVSVTEVAPAAGISSAPVTASGLVTSKTGLVVSASGLVVSTSGQVFSTSKQAAPVVTATASNMSSAVKLSTAISSTTTTTSTENSEPATCVTSTPADSKAEGEVVSLTPAGIQASLLKAKTLSSPQTVMLAPPKPDPKQDIDVEACDDTLEITSEADTEDTGKTDDEDTTLSTDVVQLVVARALSNTQAPEIQSRLQEMQRKLATVQGIITVSKQRPKSPERLVSEYHEQMKSKPVTPAVKTMFEPKVPTEEELELARQKKLKNKEEYKRRKEKDRLRKVTGMLDKHKHLLKKDLKAKSDLLEYTLRKEIRDEVFAATGAMIDIEPRTSQAVQDSPSQLVAGRPAKSMKTDKSSPAPTKAKSITTSSPLTTPVTGRPSRPSTSQYAGKRKVSLSPDHKDSPKLSKMAKKLITKPKVLQNKLYCICQKPLDKTKFYVGCDICAQWFHGSCVGIRENDKSVDSFTCEACKKHQQQTSEELYCLCNKPYNDAQFYVGCDECEGWFHPTCVGITQEEAEATDTYVCPTCKSKGSQPSFHDTPVKGQVNSIKRLVKSLQAHEMSWPFRMPVDPAKVPDYYEVVSEPMDLTTLYANLRTDTYKTVGDFVKDATKIFNNARYYNATESPVFLCAEKLEKYFVQQLKDIKVATERKS